MRRKDILEGAFKNFQQNIAKGYQATQKGGGWLAPDGVEKGIKKFFTQIDDPDKDKYYRLCNNKNCILSNINVIL